MTCPACSQDSLHSIGTVPFRDFDGSVFNCNGEFWHCNSCGMVRVITGLTDSEIADHYANDCLYVAQSGVGVGGNSQEDLARYKHYSSFIKKNEVSIGDITDVGCSRGGFLRYTASIEPSANVTGVDCDDRSLKTLRDAGFDARVGDVLDLPLPDCSTDTLTYFHVLEHVHNLDGLLAEANRVLRPNGQLVIEVPDTARYFDKSTYVGPMFWLGMKEHVNHFSLTALSATLSRSGFGIQACSRSNQPMKGDKHYPSLLVSAKKKASIPTVDLSPLAKNNSKFPEHFLRETQRMQEIADSIGADAGTKSLTFWGIGLEFFALYGYLAPLLAGGITLVDSNAAKQGLKVDGNTVYVPSSGNFDNFVYVCSYMVAEEIMENAALLGWPSNSIDSLVMP